MGERPLGSRSLLGARQIEIGAASNERWSLKSSLSLDPIMRLRRPLAAFERNLHVRVANWLNG